MAIKSGTLLKFKTNAAAVDDCTNVSISMNKQIIDVTSKDSGFWRDLLDGTRSATISFDAFVDYASAENFDAHLVDFGVGSTSASSTVTWEISTDVTGDSNLTGSGYLTSFEYTGELDDAMKYSGTIEVTGGPATAAEA